MPEITSAEAVRNKLREFDEKVDGAVAAAKTLMRIKGDAEAVLISVKNIEAKGGESLQRVEGIKLQLENLQNQWGELKRCFEKSEAESKAIRELLLAELDTAIQSLGNKLNQAQESLKATNKSSLGEQAELLKRLESSTHSHADSVAAAKKTVLEKAEALIQLLTSVRAELQEEARKRLSQAEGVLESQLKAIEEMVRNKAESTSKSLTELAASHERLIREQMSSFKDEMKRSLTEHQQLVDRQLTDFLNKQNALVQNLTQEIDGYNRISKTLSSEQGAMKTHLAELSSNFDQHKKALAADLAEKAASLGGIENVLTEFRGTLTAHEQCVANLQAGVDSVSLRLDETIQRLGKRSWLTGIK